MILKILKRTGRTIKAKVWSSVEKHSAAWRLTLILLEEFRQNYSNTLKFYNEALGF